MEKPKVLYIASLWSLVRHPSEKKEWTLEKKIKAVKEAGFDGFGALLTPEHAELAAKHGLEVIGNIQGSTITDLRKLLKQQRDAGARLINVQVGKHDTPHKTALELILKMMDEGEKLGIQPTLETHRGACTETPEKCYALADDFKKATGKVLPLTCDFSHFAVVKHLFPPYSDFLLSRPDLIQHAPQFHLRPFNGQHVQIPVTQGKKGTTPELADYMSFVEALFDVILTGGEPGRTLVFMPEMGPYGHYNLSMMPSSWTDACALKLMLAKLWKKACKRVAE